MGIKNNVNKTDRTQNQLVQKEAQARPKVNVDKVQKQAQEAMSAGNDVNRSSVARAAELASQRVEYAMATTRNAESTAQ